MYLKRFMTIPNGNFGLHRRALYEIV